MDSCNTAGLQTGMLDPGSLDVRINYTAPMTANLVVTWTYKAGESHFVATTKTLYSFMACIAFIM